MILKRFLGKSLEAAKKSARQLYGDDFVVLETLKPDRNGRTGVTVMVDREKKHERDRRSRGEWRPQKPERRSGRISDESAGVSFRRSEERHDNTDGGSSYGTTLERLRRYAREQQSRERPENGSVASRMEQRMESVSSNGSRKDPTGDADPITTPSETGQKGTPFRPGPRNSRRNGLYSRAHARPDRTVTAAGDPESGTKTDKPPSLLSRLEASRPSVPDHPEPAREHSRNSEREVQALHRRFDKLESLLDSALISANLDYASHPVFQQLVGTGISTSVIAGWFSQIIQDGIDPFEQSRMFLNRLGEIIRGVIDSGPLPEPSPYILLTGPSGSGKTTLAMKLARRLQSGGKQTGLASLFPATKSETPYYTILKPFAEDHEIPWYPVTGNLDLSEQQREWESFDHLIIDAPSISTGGEDAFRQYWNIRQMLAPLSPLEVHYVVNASHSQYYFRQPSTARHPLQPDYLDFTHLDEANRWGPLIPFLEELGCPARFISRGPTDPDTLEEFDPAWFAQQVLKES